VDARDRVFYSTLRCLLISVPLHELKPRWAIASLSYNPLFPLPKLKPDCSRNQHRSSGVCAMYRHDRRTRRKVTFDYVMLAEVWVIVSSSKINFVTCSGKSQASAMTVFPCALQVKSHQLPAPLVASPFSRILPSSSRIVTCTFATIMIFEAWTGW
jgi:hypothetical protein